MFKLVIEEWHEYVAFLNLFCRCLLLPEETLGERDIAMEWKDINENREQVWMIVS